jgi:uncharacterized protein
VGSVFQFFALTYLASWSCWIPVVVMSRSGQPSASADHGMLLLLGTIAPAVIGLALTWYQKREAGLRATLSQLVKADVGIQWYLFAILYMPAVKAAVTLSYRLATGRWPPFGREGLVVIAIATVLSTPIQAGEEIGWRGYALPALAARYGLGPASIFVGLVWGIWHLPLFFLLAADKYGQSFPVYVSGVVAFSVAIAWLYGHTQGSLLLTMLMHSAFNQTIGIVSDALHPGEKPFALGASLSFLLTIAWMWAAAAFFLIHMPRFLSIHPRQPETA